MSSSTFISCKIHKQMHIEGEWNRTSALQQHQLRGWLPILDQPRWCAWRLFIHWFVKTRFQQLLTAAESIRGWCTRQHKYKYTHMRILSLAHAEWCALHTNWRKTNAAEEYSHFPYTAICWLNALRCFLINNDASNKFFNCTTALANWRVALLF